MKTVDCRSVACRLLPVGVLVACLLPASPAFAIGETTGRVSGYVYDPTGTPLAEVPLTMTGPQLMQPVQRTSGDDGRFFFEELPPGSGYTLEVSVPGFTPIKQTSLVVEVGRDSPVDVHLTIMTESASAAQTIEIVERINPIINPDSAQKASVVTIEKAASTPIFNQVEGIPELAPGVNALSTKPSSMGGLSRWGKFYVDGMDTTDITDGSITAPMDFYAVENFEILTGGFEAQYNSMGMVENTVTKRGSNDFKYDAIVILSPPFLAAGNLTSGGTGGQYTGLYTNNSTPQPQTSFYSPILNVGGPIIKDKLWFQASFQLNLSDRETPLSLPAGIDNRPTETTTALARLNLTYQATAKDRISLSYHFDNNTIDNNLYGYQTRDAEQRVNRGGHWLVLNYDHNFTENILFNLTTGFTYKQVCFNPEKYTGGGCYDTSPGGLGKDPVAHVDSSNGYFAQFNSDEIPSFEAVGQVGNFLYQQKSHFQVDPSLTFRLGSHQLKAGVQFAFMADTETSGTDGNQRYIDRSPNPGGYCDPKNPNTFVACYELQTFYNSQGQEAPLTTSARAITTGAYIQDRWTPTRKLTIIPGMRVDWGRLYGDPSLGDNGFVTNLVGLGPRLGATYDLFGNRKSLIVAHYGRSNDVGNIFIAQHANPTLTYTQSTFSTSAGFPNCNLQNVNTLSGCQLFGGPSGRYFPSGLTPPHTDEISAGFHQALGELTAVGVDFTYDSYSNLFEEEEVNQIWDPTGTRIIGYVNPSRQGPIYQVATPDAAYRRYAGATVWGEGQPGNWDILASYTFSYDWGTATDYFDTEFSNPRFTPFWQGYVTDDRRHMLKGAITYKIPIGLDLGLRLRYLTGTPVWENFSNPANGSSFYRSPQGTCFANNSNNNVPNFSDPTSWVECRNPDTFLVDFSARYNLGQALGLRQKLEVTALIVDLFNNYETYSTTSRYGPGTFNRFGFSTGSVNGPFQAELFLRFRN
jgi:hypothetical protein